MSASVYYDPVRKRLVPYLDSGELGERYEPILVDQEDEDEQERAEENVARRRESSDNRSPRNSPVFHREVRVSFWRRRRIMILAILLPLIISMYSFTFSRKKIPTTIRIFNLNVWGIPNSGNTDERMWMLSNVLSNETFDVFILQGVWMEADHDRLKKFISKENYVTPFRKFASQQCDGKYLPTKCSGLMVVSKHKMRSLSFKEYTHKGSILTPDGFLGKGVGKVRIEVNGVTIDIFNTHVHDYDSYSREQQVNELINHFIPGSNAPVIFLGMELNCEPNTHCYNIIASKMTNAGQDFDPDFWTNSKYTTFGDRDNSFPNTKRIMDYIWFLSSKGYVIHSENFWKPAYRGNGTSISPHETLAFEFIISN